MVQGLPILKFGNDILCLACECGMKTKGSHPLILDSSITKPLDLLHINLCGSSSVASLHHNKYVF